MTMGIQDLTLSMVLIVAVGVFLASFMDAIAGGGGIISVPTYLLAGLPMHVALGTNKLSAGLGSLASTGRYIKSGYVDWKLGVPSIVLALVGSHFGTKLQLMIDEVYLQYLLLVVLPVVAFVVLRQRQLPEQRGDIEPEKQMAIVYLASLVVGAYDGFYGPGTGTFLLLIFCNLAKLDVRTAGGNVKLVNLASNIGALVTSLMSGKVFLVLGLIGTVTSFLGHFLGAGLAIIFCGYVVSLNWGAWFDASSILSQHWRWCFLLPATIALLGAAVVWAFVRDTPSSVGLPELKTGKTAEKPQSKAEEKAEYKAFLRRKVFLNPTIWIIAAKLYKQAHGLPLRAVTEQPLFYLSMLLVILGVQFFLAGFLGELIDRNASDRNKYLIDKNI